MRPKQFGNLLCKPIEQLGVAFRDIKIPKGWDIPTVQEGIDLVNNESFVKWSKFDDKEQGFYVQQPFKRTQGKWVCWLGCYGNDFSLGSYYYLDYDDAVRGVLLVKRK